MDRDIIKKGNKLVEEIDKLKSFRKNKRDGNHFMLIEHYGQDAKKVSIDRRHNDRLFKVLDEIIGELELKLENLK